MPLEFLNRRRSVPSRQLGEPGPDDAQLRIARAGLAELARRHRAALVQDIEGHGIGTCGLGRSLPAPIFPAPTCRLPNCCAARFTAFAAFRYDAA